MLVVLGDRRCRAKRTDLRFMVQHQAAPVVRQRRLIDSSNRTYVSANTRHLTAVECAAPPRLIRNLRPSSISQIKLHAVSRGETTRTGSGQSPSNIGSSYRR